MRYRPEKNKYKGFEILPRSLLRGGENTKRREDELRPESLGVLVYMLSHDDNWRILGTQIAAHFGISQSRVTSITKDLARAGYIKRRKHHYKDDDGKDRYGWDWYVAPVRQNPDRENRDLENPDLENPDLENQDVSNTNTEVIPTKKKYKEEEARTPPDGVPQDAWDKWLEYKKPLGKIKVSTARADFTALHFAGCRDFDAVVNNAIRRKWHSIGHPEWKAVKPYLRNQEMDYGDVK